DRGGDAVDPPRRAERGAVVCTGRDHHRRPRQHSRRCGRQHPDRSDRRVREGLDPRARVLHDLPTHGARARVPPDGSVRKGRLMSNRIVETKTVRTMGAPRPGRTLTINLALLGALVVLGAALPYLGASSFVVSLTSTILIAATLATSVNFLG